MDREEFDRMLHELRVAYHGPDYKVRSTLPDELAEGYRPETGGERRQATLDEFQNDTE